jgi:hypothetical protein
VSWPIFESVTLRIQVGRFIPSANFSSIHSAENIYFKFCCRKYCVIYLGGSEKFYKILPGKHKERDHLENLHLMENGKHCIMRKHIICTLHQIDSVILSRMVR